MKKKHLLLTALAINLALLCTGCASAPKETPEQAVEKLQAALKETPCTQMETALDMSAALDIPEIGAVDMSMKLTANHTMQREPVANHTVTTAELTILGESITSTEETYTVTEDGVPVLYGSSDGMWLRLDSAPSEALTQVNSDIYFDTATLAFDETITEYHGVKALCLTTKLGGDNLKATLGTAFLEMVEGNTSPEEASDTMASIDWNEISCDSRIYLNAETYLPVSQELSITGMDAALNTAFKELGTVTGVHNFTAIITYTSYETAQTVAVPEDVREKAAAWEHLLAENPDNGNGTYTIREGLALIDITIPEGFTVTKAAYDSLELTQDNINRKISYMMYYLEDGDDTSGAYFTDYVSSYEEHCITAYEETTERKQMEISSDTLTYSCDLLTTTSVSGHTEAMYCGWYPVMSDENGATYYLYVEVNDGFVSGLSGGDDSPADITTEEFVSYLSAATISNLLN